MEEDDELKSILRDAFGDSSSESDVESPDNCPEGVLANVSGDEIARPPSVFGDSHVWEPIPEINGLWICREFLSADEQASLLSALVKEGYMADDSCNQAMRFGDLPPWALEISSLIRESVLLSGHYSETTNRITGDNSKQTGLFPSELLWREPLFNQFIVNIYKPGEGICAHVDLMRFEDGIAIISLESSCVMHFSSVEVEAEEGHLEDVTEKPPGKVPVLLIPGSVVLMSGDARYLWKHEINRRPGFQTWKGQETNQRRRTSVTLRRLRQTEQEMQSCNQTK